MPKRFSPVYVPIILSALVIALYVAAVVTGFFCLVGFPIELNGWGGDIWYVIGFVIALMGAVCAFPAVLLALGAIWGMYALVMRIRRYREKRGKPPLSPIWIPVVLSVLAALGYLVFLMVSLGLFNDIQAGHWDDGLFIAGMFLFLCTAFFIWPPWGLLAIAAIWAVYGIIMLICRLARKTAPEDGRSRKRRKVTGRTPEEEIWRDER